VRKPENDPPVFPAASAIRRVPPGSGSYTLLNQQVGAVETRAPLLAFYEDKDNKSAVLAGEGFWRWRLSDYAFNGNFKRIPGTGSEDHPASFKQRTKSRFRVNHKSPVPENEPLLFDAVVYNDNYELINYTDVNMVITNRDKKSFPYTFSKTDKAYTLNAGLLSTRRICFQASYKSGDKILHRMALLRWSPCNRNLPRPRQIHDLLYSIARKSGGSVLLRANGSFGRLFV
jgi:hypothetical protein